MDIRKVGVVGSGIMGSGIAQVCAQAGYPTVMVDINDELVTRGLKGIRSQLEKSVAKGKMKQQDMDAVLGRLKGSTDMNSFKDCDFVIEAVSENIDVKKKVFSQLDTICAKHTILSTNTSTLSVTEMAAATERPQQVVGTHFFNPVPVMKLVEVVSTVVSSQESVDIAKKLCESIGKTVILAKDTPGFIVNRLLIPFMLSAVRAYESGLASKEDIDNGMVLGCNHPIGPLKLLDMLGLDTVLQATKAIYDVLKDPAFAPPPILYNMIAAGHYGTKTGKGFYDYK